MTRDGFPNWNSALANQLGRLVRFEMCYMPNLGSLGVEPGCLSVLTSTEGLFLQGWGCGGAHGKRRALRRTDQRSS
jgi:hypothetical protein